MRASKIMQERVKSMPNIHIHWSTETEEILGEDAVTGVRIRDKVTGQTDTLGIQGFFVAIGHHPNTAPFNKYVATDEQGYIVTKADSTQTNIPGVFACGDVQDKHFRQAITAAGTGAMAALEAERYLVTVQTPTFVAV